MITSTAFPERTAVAATTEPAPRPLGSPRSGTTRDDLAALRIVSHGGIDDTARALALPPAVRGVLSPIVNLARWTAMAAGLTIAGRDALDGDVRAIATLGICLFLTSWRTVLPLRLGSPGRVDRRLAIVDVVVFGLAVGLTGGPASAFIGCAVVAVALAAFGWGPALGATSLGVAGVAMALGGLVSGRLHDLTRLPALVVAVTMAAVLAAMCWTRTRLLEVERRRARGTGIDALAETNDLLTMLNSVARTLPTSLNQREALDSVRSQIVATFKPNVICLLEHDEANREWVPKIAEGCIVKPTSHIEDLPSPIRTTITDGDAVLVAELAPGDEPLGISAASRSGIYTVLRVRDRVVGVLGIEHQSTDRYNERDRRLLAGIGEILALTLDNARWFGRLRSLGAEEERVRIARDLHDRLGQWLTYISFELERMITSDVAPSQGAPLSIELTTLYADVQTALDELRETLRQLRSGVSEGRWLSKVGREIVDRFFERTEIDCDFVATNPGEHLSPAIENELLRILQEALNNIEKHSRATRVDVSWGVRDGVGQLSIHDNGAGFDQARGIRDSAYGLVGMRERTDVIGGRLRVSSAPGAGTTISVSTGIPADAHER